MICSPRHLPNLFGVIKPWGFPKNVILLHYNLKVFLLYHAIPKRIIIHENFFLRKRNAYSHEINRGSYMSTNLLLCLLNKLGKR